jgi:large subunit ribosomal protein L29
LQICNKNNKRQLTRSRQKTNDIPYSQTNIVKFLYLKELKKTRIKQMAILKVKQIREMKPEELVKKLSELKLELAKEHGSVKMGRPVKNPGKIRELRRTIARLTTIKYQTKQEKRTKK